MNPEPSQPSVPAIQMEGVVVGSLRDQRAVVAEEINWTVHPGEFWVIAGLQGSGKADFLMMTGGLMGPLGGSYRFFGEPMPIFEGARLQHRLRLGLVFESGQLFNQLTVRENVALPLCYHRNLSQADAVGAAGAMLDLLGLTALAETTPGALGGNWLKRAGLARALMLRPELLLLANPLAGLDLRHGQWWLEFLGKLSCGHPLYGGRPITLALTTSDIRPWTGLGCRFAVLKDGRLSVIGPEAEFNGETRYLLADLIPETKRDG